MKLIRAICGCAAAMLLFGGAACGGSTASNPTNEKVEARAGAESEGVGFRRRPACYSAIVAIGSRPGEINYSVKCRPREGERSVSFNVARHSPSSKPSRPGWRRIGHHPHISGPGKVHPFGICRRSGSIISCQASATQRVVVDGHFFVRASTRCHGEVAVSVAYPLECNTQACPAVGGTKSLFDGLPRGC